MQIRDNRDGYGVVSRWSHWLMALAIFAMFGLGLWMVRLDYYSPYYTSAPDAHRSFGMLLLFALLLRWVWRIGNVKPRDDELSRFEAVASHAVHVGFYVLLLVLMISGYLISSSDGQPVDVFGWFAIPSLVQGKTLATSAGDVHRIVAYAVIALAVVHAAAALKHHYLDRTSILKRMWSGPQPHRSSRKEDRT